MDILLIALVSLAASFLTFFSGFGLGTLLLPVFAIYYPVEIAVALTAVVHLLNNIFKLGLVSRTINWNIVFRFGLPSMLAAFAGAFLLKQFSGNKTVFAEYDLGGHHFSVHASGLLIGSLIIFFAFFELSKKLSSFTFSPKFLFIGGAISGFFGGLSGHQGALRSAFLLRLGMEKQVYIASGVMIACMVDVARITLYSNLEVLKEKEVDYLSITVAVLSAWTGALIGNKLFRKTSLDFFKWFVGVFMLVMGLLIALGVID